MEVFFLHSITYDLVMGTAFWLLAMEKITQESEKTVHKEYTVSLIFVTCLII